MTKTIEYTSPRDFDFTTLDNYVAPEHTLERHNKSWAEKKSAFYEVHYETFINAGACFRRRPDEVEIRCSTCSITDAQCEALRSLAVGFSIEPREVSIIEEMGVSHFFRYRTVITPRGHSGMAVVVANKLSFVFAI